MRVQGAPQTSMGHHSMNERSKENCDKKPISSNSCKYLYSTHFAINKLKSWVPHAYH